MFNNVLVNSAVYQQSYIIFFCDLKLKHSLKKADLLPVQCAVFIDWLLFKCHLVMFLWSNKYVNKLVVYLKPLQKGLNISI